MPDIYQPPKSGKSDLDPCDREVFTFARQIGVAGAISLLVGEAGSARSEEIQRLEEAINAAVYKLYDLSQEEIKVIEQAI